MSNYHSYTNSDAFVTLPLDGKIFMDNQRVLMTSTAAMGLLRKDLIEMVGKKRMKQFLLRYGWSLGVHDATQIFLNNNYPTIEDMLLAGPKMHMQNGHVYVQTQTLEVDRNQDHFYMEGVWKHSYEADENKKLFGLDTGTTCFTSVGYASGYLSTILGKVVIVKEVQCEGKGDHFCKWIAKSADEWEEEVDKDLASFSETSMIKELELAYEKIKEERDNLTKSFTIHKRLTGEIIQGHDLQSIANVLLEALDIPVLIEDRQFNLIAAAGLNAIEEQKYNEQIKQLNGTEKKYFNELKLEYQKDFKAHIVHVGTNHYRLMIPILLNQKISGYCSVVRSVGEFTTLEKMIIERASVVCAMYLLNERTALEAEQRIRGNILEEILAGDLCKQELLKLGDYVGLDFLKPFTTLVVDTSKQDEQNVRAQMEWKGNIVNRLSQYFKNMAMKVILTLKSNQIVLMIANDMLVELNKKIDEFANEIRAFCMEISPKHIFYVGISTSTNKIEHAKQQYEEALAALKICTKYKPIIPFNELGIIGVLIQTGDREAIKRYANLELKDLLDYDHKKCMDLTKTLYHYIINGGNLDQTAHSMALSISGLRYRIEKIKDILTLDIRQPTVSYSLFLALQTLILLGELQFNS
ncbi:XylR N-terminal domain-containing protein [Bacillus sp. Marseille-P3661]|uniref:XylR N-terminal domain-containing protein n=1 Tax=Bacillus sp. Marseille-P3661 TaxID=1936234 RepID=UPI000C8385E5|nr:XylR N-terminal domain-containing protein [Bacillus sp. Marseille-P3661]